MQRSEELRACPKLEGMDAHKEGGGPWLVISLRCVLAHRKDAQDGLGGNGIPRLKPQAALMSRPWWVFYSRTNPKRRAGCSAAEGPEGLGTLISS